jgi:hypothetical protein
MNVLGKRLNDSINKQIGDQKAYQTVFNKSPDGGERQYEAVVEKVPEYHYKYIDRVDHRRL